MLLHPTNRETVDAPFTLHQSACQKSCDKLHAARILRVTNEWKQNLVRKDYACQEMKSPLDLE